MQKKVKKKTKIKFGKIILFLIILFLIGYLLFYLLNLPITNIYISNNNLLKDQEIIEEANLEDYPSTFSIRTKKIEKKLTDNVLIKKAKVKRTHLFQIYIEIEENKPLFYNENNEKTVLSDGKESEIRYNVPNLINYIPDSKYETFIKVMNEVDASILEHISEIKYDPNSVDDERFMLYMNDSNYVYINLNKFNSINSYLNIIKKFSTQKGILYLDSGEYFQVLN